MRLTLLGLVALGSLTSTTAYAQSQSDSNTGRITGHVVTAYADLLNDVTVTLARTNDQGVSFPARTTRSDTDGAFSFSQLPSGQYRLQASKPGYTSRQFEVITNSAIDALNAGPAVDLAPDTQVNVQILLRRTASIAGRIIRPDGSAAANVRVEAAIRSGNRRLPLFGITTTSQADGRYELTNLPPGDYLVGAMSVALPTRQQFDAIRNSQAARNAALAATAVAHRSWYPGVPENEPGATVTLAEGVNAEGIDIWLTPSQWFTVSGQVFWPVGVAINGISIDYGDPTGNISGVWMVSDADGLFTVGTVPPGLLTLLARADTDQGELIGIASTEVTIESVQDVRIIVDRPGRITGRIVYEGTVPQSSRATSIVAVQKLLKVSALYPVPESAVDSNGRFELVGTIGAYELALGGLASGLVIKRAMRNGRSLTMNRVDVSAGETIRDIELVVGR
jgi:hypothetical protein